MVSTRRPRALDVWMNGEHVGTWTVMRGGMDEFRYETGWVESPRCRPVSLSLPILPGNQVHRGAGVADWFDNLLPDSQAIRERIRHRFRTPSARAFDLLAAIGRDCVGAVQLVPAGNDPGDVRHVRSTPLDEAGVARILRGVTASPTMGGRNAGDEFRISIAGAQEKTALLFHEGRWHAPLGATPTTHILKLPLGLVGNMRANMHDSVENEWACMEVLRALGLPVAQNRIGAFEDEVSRERALVVTRFDRQWTTAGGGESAWLLRLPQEDFCQATGTPAHLRYENDGGPGVARSLALLRAGDHADEDSLTFAQSQLAFWLLAATDGHAKNFSIFLRRDGYAMTPLYDVLSAWPIIGTGPNELAKQDATLAMAIRGSRPHRHLGELSVRHWRSLAHRTGAPNAFERMVDLVERSDGALDTVEQMLPPGYPAQLWERIAAGARSQRRRFLDVLAREG